MDIGEIVAIGFWASFIASSGLSVWGVVRSSARVLLLGAIFSLPFALLMFAYPVARYFLALPVLYLIAASTVHGAIRWVSWVMLALIGAFAAWFLLLRFVLWGGTQP